MLASISLSINGYGEAILFAIIVGFVYGFVSAITHDVLDSLAARRRRNDTRTFGAFHS